MSSGIRTEGPFRYLSSQRPLRILDIFDQTAAEVWEREKNSSMKKRKEKKLVTDDKKGHDKWNTTWITLSSPRYLSSL